MSQKDNKKNKNEALEKILKIISDKTKMLLGSPFKLFKVLIIIFVLEVLVIVWIFVYVYFRNLDLNNQSQSLLDITEDEKINYWLLEKDFTNKINANSLDWLISYFNEQLVTKNKLSDSFDKMQVSYNYFLKNIFLPSLNIWYDPYIRDYNLSIYWGAYIQKNPFVDINLMRKWWDFFKKVDGGLPFNDIKNIKIWWLTEDQNGYVKIKISVDFTANQRRSFLMLVDKLSISSNKRNISLITEFTSDLWNTIREEKSKELESLAKSKFPDKKKFTEDDINLTLWEQMYNWVQSYCWNEYTDVEKATCKKKYEKAPFGKLITQKVIEDTIKTSADCNINNWSSITSDCYFKFRDKFRDIPFLAYSIWENNNNNDKPNLLKKFYFDIPPALNITKFTFSKWEKTWISDDQNQYKWVIELEIYGRDLSDQDISDIQWRLGSQCYSSGTNLTLELAMQKIDQRLSDIAQKKSGTDADFNSNTLRDLTDLKWVFTDIQSKYGELSHYQKAIKAFEIYRMLNDWNLCKTK